MNKETLLQQIDILLETTLEQYHQIQASQGRIPQIEIDLVMSNLRQTYEYVSMLDYQNRKAGVENIAPANSFVEEKSIPAPLENTLVTSPTVEVKTPAVEEPKSEILPESKVEEKVETEITVPVVEQQIEAKPEVFVSETPADVQDEESESEVKEEYIKVEMTREMVKEFISMGAAPETPAPTAVPAASLFDDIPPPAISKHVNHESRLSNETPSFYDKFTQDKVEENSFVEKLQKKRIADLKAAIGINEKFLFINELFEGNLALYNEGIEKLNSCTNINDAKGYVDGELRTKFNWTNSPKADKMLMELIERRFIG